MRISNNDHRPHGDFGNFDGIGSSGLINNPMYRSTCVKGFYEPQSGRCQRRLIARKKYGVCLTKGKKFWDL